MSVGWVLAQVARDVRVVRGFVPFRLISAGIIIAILAGVGLTFYGYSLSPQPKQVHVEISNDQFPQ
jgi:hypothetical protein